MPEILHHIESHVCSTYFDIYVYIFFSELIIECMVGDILHPVAP